METQKPMSSGENAKVDNYIQEENAENIAAAVESMNAEQASQETKEPVSIPCPANNDELVICADPIKYAAQSGLNCLNKGGTPGCEYVVLDKGCDVLAFVLTSSKFEQPLSLILSESCPGFDSIFMWRAVEKDAQDKHWLVCIHFPVSGRRPLQDSCRQFIVEADFIGHMEETIVQAFSLENLMTLSRWRESLGTVSPSAIYNCVEKIARRIEELFATGHSLLRIGPDNIAIRNGQIYFMGIGSLDQPWNERCATAHQQIDYVPIPPECLGFLRQRITSRQRVYMIGALAYYLVAGSCIPTCEVLAYEPAIDARAYNPSFPLGWGDIIQKAIQPNPDHRFESVPEFIDALHSALELMHDRRDFRDSVYYDVAVDTHIGVTKKLRCPVNQDAVFTRQSESGQRILMVVADGVSTSTYGSGDIASTFVVKTAEQFWNDSIASAETIDASQIINDILLNANDAITQYIIDNFGDQNPSPSDCMGTTALVAIVENGVLTLGSIGDSRAYLIRSDSFECITRDHNLFTVGILNGLSVEMCASHPHAGSLVQCLGYYAESEEGLAYDIFSTRLIPGDVVMLTTDGILDYIACELAESEIRIADIIRRSKSASLACLELIMQANLGGGGDNCGVGIIRVLHD